MNIVDVAKEYMTKIAIATVAGTLKGVPSGELYAEYMGKGIDLDAHQHILAVLERTKMIEVRNHLCVCINEKILAATRATIADLPPETK